MKRNLWQCHSAMKNGKYSICTGKKKLNKTRSRKKMETQKEKKRNAEKKTREGEGIIDRERE